MHITLSYQWCFMFLLGAPHPSPNLSKMLSMKCCDFCVCLSPQTSGTHFLTQLTCTQNSLSHCVKTNQKHTHKQTNQFPLSLLPICGFSRGGGGTVLMMTAAHNSVCVFMTCRTSLSCHDSPGEEAAKHLTQQTAWHRQHVGHRLFRLTEFTKESVSRLVFESQ